MELGIAYGTIYPASSCVEAPSPVISFERNLASSFTTPRRREIPYPPIYPVVPEAKLFLQPFSQVNNGPCTFPLTAIKLRQPLLCLTSSLFITPSPRCTSLQHVHSGLPLIWLECKPLSHECIDLPDQLISGHNALQPAIKDFMRLWANAFALLYTIRTIQYFGERRFWNAKNWWI